LKAYARRGGELLNLDAKELAALPESRADMDIDEMKLSFGVGNAAGGMAMSFANLA
jgi:hypothetical protein